MPCSKPGCVSPNGVRSISSFPTPAAVGSPFTAFSTCSTSTVAPRPASAGAGLVDEVAARTLVSEGPGRVRELLEWGARFDRNGAGELAFTREGAHSRNRVLHADGASTGREIGRTLSAHAGKFGNIHFSEFGFTRDLLLEDGRVVGVEILHEDGSIEAVTARAVLLATGGSGMVFANTTNPDVATSDGAAIADELRGLGFACALRSRGERPERGVDIYICDTLGELGLFYRLAGVVLAGKSFMAKAARTRSSRRSSAAPSCTGRASPISSTFMRCSTKPAARRP